MKNNGFISQTYLNSLIEQCDEKDVNKLFEGIKLFFEDVKYHIFANHDKEKYNIINYMEDFLLPSIQFRYII
ncbi:MAG: hypothetical protein WD512_18120, partial [Candidatus Paceibacterota bacterium]